jgi:hypothetical protein
MAIIKINEKKKLIRIEPEVYGHFSEHLGRWIYEGLYVGENGAIPNENGMRADVVEALREIPGVALVRPVSDEGNTVEVCCDAGADLRLAVSRCVTDCGASILELTPMQGGLENAFLRLLDASEEVQP